MGKLLFEDDSGKQHEIKITNIAKKSIKKEDVILAYYEIGDTSNSQASQILQNIHSTLSTIFENRILVLATRHGKKDLEITITNKE